MSTLDELLGKQRGNVVADLSALADKTIKGLSGISGTTIKGALSTATTVDSNFIPKAINKLLPELLEKLEPEWQAYQNSSVTSFAEFLKEHSSEVKDGVLEIADSHKNKISVPLLKKAFGVVRSKADKLLEPIIPEIGAILEKNMNL